jgi:hypothetical protein
MAEAEKLAGEGGPKGAIVCTGLSNAARELAWFCVDNHALVAGIDKDMPIQPSHMTQPAGGGRGVWGGPPKPGTPQAGPPLSSHIVAEQP